MTQASLLDYVPPARHTTQERELARVSGRIAESVLAFCRARVGQEFVGAQLLAHVEADVGHVAPDSPGRVLRALAKAGQVTCVLVSRSGSRYRVEGVR